MPMFCGRSWLFWSILTSFTISPCNLVISKFHRNSFNYHSLRKILPHLGVWNHTSRHQQQPTLRAHNLEPDSSKNTKKPLSGPLSSTSPDLWLFDLELHPNRPIPVAARLFVVGHFCCIFGA